MPPKTIRYYEEIELVSVKRSDNGYRRYGDTEVNKLRFVRRARSLGFKVKDCKTLLSLYEDKTRPSAAVKKIASGHLDVIDAKIAELRNMRAELVDHLSRDSWQNRSTLSDPGDAAIGDTREVQAAS